MKPIIAIVFKQTPEHLVCFRFQSSGSCIFVIFDAHSRSEHPFGPAFILASDVDTVATCFNQLLTQPSISQPASKQDITAKPYSFTALVIESRENSFTTDDLLTRSVAYLSEKLSTADHTPSTLNLGTPGHLERLRVRAESLRTQKLADAAHKQDNNRQTGHTRPSTSHGKDPLPSTKLPRRSEFGWQLNLQTSGTSSAVDPKNNKDPNLAESPNPLEIKKMLMTDSREIEFDWLAPLIPGPGLDSEDVDISTSSASKVDKENIPDQKLSHMRSRSEFGWQMALQQSLKADKRNRVGDKDLEIMTSAVVPQADVQTRGVLLGKGKEASGEVSATQTVPKGSESAWPFVRWLSEEEELVASSSKYPSRDGAWILASQRRRSVEEDKVNNAVTSSSSSSHAKLGEKKLISPYHHELDFKPLPSTEGENSTIHHNLRYSSIFPNYLDPVSNRGFVTLELPTSEFSAESHECGVCNELYGVAQIIQLPTCIHTFCIGCLRTFTKTKINEGRYPIICPVCSIERTRANQSRELVPSAFRSMDNLKIS